MHMLRKPVVTLAGLLMVAGLPLAHSAANPATSNAMGPDDARHLLSRTSFAASDADIQRLAKLSRADAAAQVPRFGVAGPLHDGQDLRRAHAGLAVEHRDPAGRVLGEERRQAEEAEKAAKAIPISDPDVARERASDLSRSFGRSVSRRKNSGNGETTANQPQDDGETPS